MVERTHVVLNESPGLELARMTRSFSGNIWPLVILVLIMLALATASRITTNNMSTVVTNDTDIDSLVSTWTSLNSSIAAAAGKAVTLTLSTPFDMAGFKVASKTRAGPVSIQSYSRYKQTPPTAIAIVGSGAVFDAAGAFGSMLSACYNVPLVMSNVTVKNGNGNGSGMTSTHKGNM
jgi:hypothetical protein